MPQPPSPDRPRTNTQLFALREPPPARLVVAGQAYRLAKVFKHDFFAATSLYEAEQPVAEPPRLVVKLGREQPFWGLPMDWIGRYLRRREERLHARLAGVTGIQRWAAGVRPTGFALAYVEGVPLDSLGGPPPPGFFDALRAVLGRLHERGVAYCDMNKRSNVIVGPDGSPALIDFQIALALPRRGAGRVLLGPVVRYLQGADLYHLYKHKRRLAPQELTAEEDALSRRRGPLVRLHRALATPLRRLRRRFLARQYRSGRLVSPTAELETHDQPEKATWRKDDP